MSRELAQARVSAWRHAGTHTTGWGSKRRRLMIVLGFGALAGSLACPAQQRKVWRVGVISSGRSTDSDSARAFRQGMRQLGYVEGGNLTIEWRFAQGEVARLPGLAGELVQLGLDVIVAATPSVVDAVRKATSTIPIVMVNVSDPVASGFVKSLSRPGGNITGTSTVIGELGPKLLEMLLAIAPRLPRAGVLVHPEVPDHLALLKNIRTAAQRSNVDILAVEARTVQDIESALTTMSKEGARAVIVTAGPFVVHRQRIADLAAKHRLPSIAAARQYAEAGGLMSYGPDPIEPYRYAATYVDKILKGARPGDLPVEQPTRFSLLVNGKTARALGITIPQSILVRADRVIE